MALRRSSRRLTITGNSVFSASTPVVSHVDKENVNSNNNNNSPQWVSADEAFSFKTPKFTRLTRRTTLTRESVFLESEERENSDQGFNAPSFFIPVSPPGVKTRSRRSSIYVVKNDNLPKKKSTISNIPQARGKVQKNISGKIVESKDENIVSKDRKKFAKKTNEKVVSPNLKHKVSIPTSQSLKSLGQKRIIEKTDSDMNQGKSPYGSYVEIKDNIKKSRKSMSISVNVSEKEITKPAGPQQNTEYHANKIDVNEKWDMKSDENDKERNLDTKNMESRLATPKVSTSGSAERVVEMNKEKDRLHSERILRATPVTKFPSLSKATKRLSSEKEIDKVVKKMFSPDSHNSESKHKKFSSPNAGKALASPARITLLKEMANVKSSSRKQSLGRATNETSVSVGPKTPSRAAPKAKRILGVSTPMSVQPSENKHETNESEEVYHICEEPPISSFSEEVDDASFRSEDENNLTLSHTSHSQWCTIL